MRMVLRVKRIGWGKPFLLICIIIIAVFSTLNFSYKFSSNNGNDVRVNQIERKIFNLHETVKVDCIRQSKIQKIINIINQYNREMSYQEKISIAEQIYMMTVKFANLDIDLICATITHESALTWNPKVISQAGAMGLMQIMPTTGIFLCQYEGIKWTSAENILFDPLYNIRLGCRYLSSLIHAYEIDGGLAAYNGGEKRAALWIKNNRRDESILWEETRGYIPAVLRLYKQFQQENGII